MFYRCWGERTKVEWWGKNRVAIARTLLKAPAIVLLDVVCYDSSLLGRQD